MKIRIRHAGGSTTLEIPSNATAGDVAKAIADAIHIPASEQSWKGGFPPKPIKLNASDVLPKDVDLIRVAKAEASVEFSKSKDEESSDNPIKIDDAMIESPNMVDPDGFVVRRVMDADNSCLFNSVGYSIQRSRSPWYGPTD